jgi:holo-[acyl-carrier protein] synthase
MIVGVGVDVVEIARVARALQRHPGFGVRVFTKAEREASAARGVGAVAHLARRWAAKEAVSKALGVGFSGFSYTDIEVANLRSGAPTVAVHGELGEWVRQLGVVRWHVSLSDTAELAFATVVAEGPEVLPPPPAGPPPWVRRRLDRNAQASPAAGPASPAAGPAPPTAGSASPTAGPAALAAGPAAPGLPAGLLRGEGTWP